MLLSITINTLIFFLVNSAEERKEQVRIIGPNSFILGPCLRDKERELGPFLHFVSNAAPDSGTTTTREMSLLELERRPMPQLKRPMATMREELTCLNWRVSHHHNRRGNPGHFT